MDGFGSMMGVLEDSVFGNAFEEDTSYSSSSKKGYVAAACEARGKSGLVGLSNQGATCYLNSALQSLFMTPEFRSQVFALSPDELNVAAYEEEEKERREAEERERLEKEAEAERKKNAAAAGAAVSEPPAQPKKPKREPLDMDAVKELVESFGFEEKLVKKALRKYPRDGQREIAINYLLEGEISDAEEEEQEEAQEQAKAAEQPTVQADSSVGDGKNEAAPEAASSSMDAPSSSTSGASAAPVVNRPKPRRIPIELQRLFARLQGLEANATTTAALTDSFGWGGSGRVAVQQDVFELTTQLMDALERSLRNTAGSAIVNDIFKFKMINRIRCSQCKSTSQREEEFMGYPVTVQGCSTLHQALARSCSLEHFSGANLYRCSMGCNNQKTEAARSSVFQTLPPVLLLNLNRFTWNERGERVKLNHKFSFPRVLDMAPYMESELPIEAMVENKLEPLCPEYKPAGGAAAAVASAASSSTAPEASSSKPNNKKANKGKKGARGGDEDDYNYTLEEPTVVNEQSPHLYDLYAVVIHAGSPYGGHYTAYIQDVFRVGKSSYSDDAKASTSSSDSSTSAAFSSAASSSTPGWFYFNDSQVASIPVQRLASQYGGGHGSTAYMLFYRLRSLGEPKLPPLPVHLNALIDVENVAVLKEREVYEKYMNSLSLRIYTENLFKSYPDGHIEFVSRFPTDDRGLALEIEIDRRLPLVQLQNAVQNALRQHAETLQKRLQEHPEFDSSLDPSFSILGERLLSMPPESLCFAKLDMSVANLVALYKTKASKGDIESTDIADHDQLLVFDGASVNGDAIVYSQRKGMRLVISCTQLSKKPLADDTPALSSSSDSSNDSSPQSTLSSRTFTFVGEKDVHTAADLLAFLKQHIDLTDDDLWTHQIKYEKLSLIDLLSQPSKLLVELGLTDGASLMIESRAETAAELATAREMSTAAKALLDDDESANIKPFDDSSCSLAAEELRTQKARVRLTIVHHCAECIESSENKEFELLLSTSITVSTLKSLILSKLSPTCRLYHSALGYRLRRLIGQTKEGALYCHENMTLQAVELDQDDLRVQIEHGHLPQAGEGEVQVSVKHPHTQQRSEHLMMLDLRRTIKDVKKQILEAAGIDEPKIPFCLYRTDVTWNERGKLFANENISLEKLGITSGDNLWLEQGEIPSKGLVNLDFYQFAMHANSGAEFCRSRLLENRDFLISGGSGSALALTSVDSTACSNSASAESAETKSVEDKKVESDKEAEAAVNTAVAEGLHRLFTLEIQSNDNLIDLKQALHSQPQLSHVPSPDHFRVRLFRGHQPGKIVASNDQPLKKQGITADRSIVIQIIPEPEKGLGAYATLLQCYLALPHPKKSGDLLFSLFPVEVLWDGGLTANFDTLYSSLSSALNIPKDDLALCKWVNSERRWQHVSEKAQEVEMALLLANEEKRKKEKEEQAVLSGASGKGKKQQASGKKKDKITNAFDPSAMTDEELAELLASGFDLNGNSTDKASSTDVDVVKPASEESVSAQDSTANNKSRNAKGGNKAGETPKKAKAGNDSKSGKPSEKDIEMAGLRGKPFLLRDGDILVVLDLRDFNLQEFGRDPAARVSAETTAVIDQSQSPLDRFLGFINEWSPPPNAMGGAGVGSDYQRAIEESLKSYGGNSQNQPEMGVVIEVDV